MCSALLLSRRFMTHTGTVKKGGKADYRLFRSISRLTGSRRDDVLLGPMFGADFGVIDNGGSRVIAISTDPIYVDNYLPHEDAAWFAFHVIVADVALSGLKPSHLAVSWNLPPEMDDRTFLSISRVFDSEAKTLDMSIVTGHTGRYDGCKAPILGAGTSIAVGRKERLILPSGIRPGDRLILTKSPGLETALLLSHRFGSLLSNSIGRAATIRLRRKLRLLSPVSDAAIATASGGVSAMHDASERGVYGALYELSRASGLSFAVEPDKIIIDRDVRQIADFLSFDPLRSSSEGTLLITADEDSAARIVRRLANAGITGSICGTAMSGKGGLFEVNSDGTMRPVMEPLIDGFLTAKSAAERKYGLSASR